MYIVGFDYCFNEIDVNGLYVCVGVFDGFDCVLIMFVDNLCWIVSVLLLFVFGISWNYLLLIDVVGVLIEVVCGVLFFDVIDVFVLCLFGVYDMVFVVCDFVWFVMLYVNDML